MPHATLGVLPNKAMHLTALRAAAEARTLARRARKSVPHLRTIAEEPVGATYVALIRFAEAEASTFSLVWRHQLEFDPAAHEIAEVLRPSMIRQQITDEWPGTRLLGHAAIVRFYEMSSAARRVLESADRLYGWTAPGRPEDLAFYTAAGHCWLGSIAHEQDAFVDSDVIDLSDVVAGVPGLRLKSDTT